MFIPTIEQRQISSSVLPDSSGWNNSLFGVLGFCLYKLCCVMSHDLAAGGRGRMAERAGHGSGRFTRPVENPTRPGTPLDACTWFSFVVLLQGRVQQHVVCECGCFILGGTQVSLPVP